MVHNVLHHNVIAPSWVDPRVLDDGRLHRSAVVRSELNTFETATSGTSKCSVQSRSCAVKVNTVVFSREQYHFAHFESHHNKLVGGKFQDPAALSPVEQFLVFMLCGENSWSGRCAECCLAEIDPNIPGMGPLKWPLLWLAEALLCIACVSGS